MDLCRGVCSQDKDKQGLNMYQLVPSQAEYKAHVIVVL